MSEGVTVEMTLVARAFRVGVGTAKAELARRITLVKTVEKSILKIEDVDESGDV